MDSSSDAALAPYLPALTAMLDRLTVEQMVARLWAHDPSLWYPAATTQARISERLGWLDAPLPVDPALQAWINALSSSHYTAILWIAVDAGASVRLWQSLATGLAAPPRLILLDTVEPQTVHQRLAGLDPSKTAAVCAAVELTPEVEALCDVVIDVLGLNTSSSKYQFSALTSSGSSLQAWLDHRVPYHFVAAPARVTERFAALTPLGSIPPVLREGPVERLQAAAEEMQHRCQHTTLPYNPGVWLGVVLGILAQHGRDILTLIAPWELQPLAEWIALFVGGSLAKHRRGLVPVVGEPMLPTTAYGRARIFVQLRLGTPKDMTFDEQTAALAGAGHPVLRFTVSTDADHAAQIVCWQVGVAVAGVILGVNPFDEPDTVALRAALQRHLGTSAPPTPPLRLSVNNPLWEEQCHAILTHPLASYVALVLYNERTPAVEAQLVALRARLGQTGLATLVVEPLRDPLYATQVLHAGRPQGIILALSGEHEHGRLDRYHRLTQLSAVRAAVDAAAWTSMGRTTLHINLGRDVVNGLARVYAALETCISDRPE